MRILLSGIGGHMGKEVARLAMEGYHGAELVVGVDINACGSEPVESVKTFSEVTQSVDCIVDFSHHSVTDALLDFAVQNNIPTVIATTGQTDAERAAILCAAEKIPLFFAANYSLGIALLIELAKKTASIMPDAEIEIIEKHHDRKLDAPSGTAIAIADAIRQVRPMAYTLAGRNGHGKRQPEEIGIHAIRMGDIVGEHEVIIGTKTQTITLKHEAHTRALFAEGALVAAEFICGRPAGLYDMQSILELY